MSDKLKTYIQMHRDAFDQLQPPDLWPAVSTGLVSAAAAKGILAGVTKFKIWLGLSAVAVTGTIATIVMSAPSPQKQLSSAGTQLFTVPTLEAATLQVGENPPPVPEPDGNGQPSQKQAVAFIKEDTLSADEVNHEEETLEEASSGAIQQPVAKAEVRVNKDNEFISFSFGLSSREDTSTQYVRTVDTVIKGVRRLVVKGDFCDVKATTAAGPDLTFKARITEVGGSHIVCGTKSYRLSRAALKYAADDTVFKVWMESEKVKMHKVKSAEKAERSVLEFTVPAGIVVILQNSSGNIQVREMNCSELTLKSDFGNITARKISAKLWAKCSSGNIRLQDLDGDTHTSCDFGHTEVEQVNGNLHVRSSSGRVLVKNVTGQVDSKTSFGGQSIEDIKGNVIAVSSSGQVKVRNVQGNLHSKASFGNLLFENITGNIESAVSSGSIRLINVAGLLKLSSEFGNITGTEVKLTGASDLRSSSGSIRMELLNPMTDLQFDLQSGSGRIVVDKEGSRSVSDKSLSLGSGRILVTTRTKFGNQEFK